MLSIETIDLNWMGRPQSVAAALLESDGAYAVIDPGPESTLPSLRAALAKRNLTVQNIDAILLTHIHLDHAGATGALVQENPNLAVFVHEMGAIHMADPSRLLASAGRLYQDQMATLYGDCKPVPEENLQALAGGETLAIGNHDLSILYTPGHASHHVTYWDAVSRVAFVGDTAGIRVEGDAFQIPPTPPPDIDLEQWNDSLDQISALQPQRMFLTHFGYANDPEAHIAKYRSILARWENLVRSLLSQGMDEETAGKAFVKEVTREMNAALPADRADHYVFNAGIYLSWLGLLRMVKKKAKQ